MNHIFKVIFNRSLRTCVVCSEICKSLSKSKVLKAALSLALPVMTLLVNGAAWAAPSSHEINNEDDKLGFARADYPNQAYYGVFWYENDSVPSGGLSNKYNYKANDSIPTENGTTISGITVLNNRTEINSNSKKYRAYGGKAVSTVNSTKIIDTINTNIVEGISSSQWGLTRQSGDAKANGNILYLNEGNKQTSITENGHLYYNRLASIRGGKVIQQQTDYSPLKKEQ